MELLPEGQRNTTEVLWEDQQKINEFSKLINRKDEFESDLNSLKQEKEYLDDVSMEIELIDDEELINYKIGDTFLLLKASRVIDRLSKDNEIIDLKIEKLSNEIDITEDRLTELKHVLYAKFGNSINLER
ncbi:hypothetical protein PACTADRAFT_32641 [Pachysolen tannophilus NRRL Y-2460]|uniref:Prefoldin subunit 4 n=1 Tax=Pachysolen tannophilus NRRL Y-2460 TaxID=669874 RepID=A0A1E4TZI9_PACTA|nr:hypothetical protein PACTADRAFT_32641 [Pachysolen tannophilus NRRL Y-2460]